MKRKEERRGWYRAIILPLGLVQLHPYPCPRRELDRPHKPHRSLLAPQSHAIAYFRSIACPGAGDWAGRGTHGAVPVSVGSLYGGSPTIEQKAS